MLTEHQKQQCRTYYYNHREEMIKKASEYSKTHREQRNIATKKSQQKLRRKVVEYYSQGKMCCACCGEKTFMFLVIDHVENDGFKYKINGERQSSFAFWHFLETHHYPSGYQVLCQNCNFGKMSNGGECPHKDLVKHY